MVAKTPLELVLYKTETEAQAMTERLEKAQAFIEQEKQQLKQLQDYSEEYASNIQQKQSSWSAAQISHYRSFLLQLTNAVNAQKIKIATAEDNTEKLRQQLLLCRHKTSVLSELILEQQQEFQRQQDRVLQKELDELAMRTRHQF